MKKLMILAAAAAMAGTVSAVEAQVYDAVLSVKTTTCKDGKYTKALENFPASRDTIYGNMLNYSAGDQVKFRKQATRKFAGVFWGCDCETIADPKWRVYTSVSARRNAKTVGGYAFWDATKSPYIPFTIPYVTFEWLVLNRIDQMKSVEGTWVLRDKARNEALFLVGAGFGTVNNANNGKCEDYIKSISGNFAGFRQYADGGEFGCVFCGVSDYACLVAPFCWCDYEDTTYLTAAYGTWTIKYNATSTKQLRNVTERNTVPYITDVKAYKGKAFTNGDPSVVDALEAQKTAVLEAELTADSDYSYSFYASDVWHDLEGNLVDKRGNVIRKPVYAIENKDLLNKTLFPYLAALSGYENTEDYVKDLNDPKKSVKYADPLSVEDDASFPANAKKYVDPS